MKTDITDLLDKYWKGKTSLEEEKTIKEYFNHKHEISLNGNYFRFLSWKKREVYKIPNREKLKKYFWWSAAATIAIVAYVSFLMKEPPKDTYAIQNPEEALQATKEVLFVISTQMNSGKNLTKNIIKLNDIQSLPENKKL